MQFSEILAAWPTIDHVAALLLFDGDSLDAHVENKSGTASSVCLMWK